MSVRVVFEFFGAMGSAFTVWIGYCIFRRLWYGGGRKP